MSTLILTKELQELFEKKEIKKSLKKSFGSTEEFYNRIIKSLNDFDKTLELKDVSFASIQDADKYIGIVLDSELGKKYNICLIPPVLGTRSGFLAQQLFGFISNIILSDKYNDKYLADKPIIIINCLIKDKLADSETCNIISAKILGFHYIDLFNRKQSFENEIKSFEDYYNQIKEKKESLNKDFDYDGKKIIFKTERLKNLKERLTNEPYYFAINAYPALYLASKEGKEIDISAFKENKSKNISNKNIDAFIHYAENLMKKAHSHLPADNKYNKYLKILRTKPFLLLAGISGTGKSRLVKELAYMTCPRDGEQDSNKTEPGNYCLIEVKPNWHDSTELLGYYSNLSGRYELTKFIRFAYKAIKHPEVPFFVCLDEMNLAPVEQYFAEYLSVLETRKLVSGTIVSSDLLTKDTFANCELQKSSKNLFPTEYSPFKEGKCPKDLKMYSDEDAEIIQYLKTNGMQLPENLFVIGTVNMDDTTHQFSRKVIDRAFTIEMNGDNLSKMFDDTDALEYKEPNNVISLKVFKANYVTANEALEQQTEEIQNKIKTNVPDLLESVNDILKDTPFCVSYRVQNELILYICSLLAESPDDLDAKISEAFLTILLTKILPRIQGDDQLLATKKDSNVLRDLANFIKEKYDNVNGSDLQKSVIDKLEKMDKRLEKSYFTNFFG